MEGQQYDVSVSNGSMLVNQACEWFLNSDLPAVEKFLLILLLRNGLRVSEICRASDVRLQGKYSAFIYSTKNNVWRRCVTAEAADLLDDGTVEMDLKFWNRSRQYYYRKLKGLLPDIETTRTGNVAVTHAARYVSAQEALQVTSSIEAAALSIGDKSVNATSHYINRRQRKALQTSGILDPISGTTSSINMTKRGVVRRKRT